MERASARQKERRDSQQPTDENGAVKEAIETSENESPLPTETDEGVYCVCRGKDDGSYMLACEKCDEWYHGRCVGINKRAGDKLLTYVCLRCQPVTEPGAIEPPTNGGDTDDQVNLEAPHVVKSPSKPPQKRALPPSRSVSSLLSQADVIGPGALTLPSDSTTPS